MADRSVGRLHEHRDDQLRQSAAVRSAAIADLQDRQFRRRDPDLGRQWQSGAGCRLADAIRRSGDGRDIFSRLAPDRPAQCRRRSDPGRPAAQEHSAARRLQGRPGARCQLRRKLSVRPRQPRPAISQQPVDHAPWQSARCRLRPFDGPAHLPLGADRARAWSFRARSGRGLRALGRVRDRAGDARNPPPIFPSLRPCAGRSRSRSAM